jgi:hypothetical protein
LSRGWPKNRATRPDSAEARLKAEAYPLWSKEVVSVATPHLPHPHAPHADFDHHPWRMLPTALLVIVVLATVLIVVSFAISKAITGHAY